MCMTVSAVSLESENPSFANAIETNPCNCSSLLIQRGVLSGWLHEWNA